MTQSVSYMHGIDQGARDYRASSNTCMHVARVNSEIHTNAAYTVCKAETNSLLFALYIFVCNFSIRISFPPRE